MIFVNIVIRISYGYIDNKWSRGVKCWTTISGRSRHWALDFIMKTYQIKTYQRINCNKCIIAAILIFSHFTLMLVPQNLENARVQVLIQLRHSLPKVNNTSSSWFGFFFDVSQSSILGSLLFNFFLEGLFFILNNVDIASYANDNTLNAVCRRYQWRNKIFRKIIQGLIRVV